MLGHWFRCSSIAQPESKFEVAVDARALVQNTILEIQVNVQALSWMSGHCTIERKIEIAVGAWASN